LFTSRFSSGLILLEKVARQLSEQKSFAPPKMCLLLHLCLHRLRLNFISTLTQR